MEKIKDIIDLYFNFMEELNANSFISELIPPSMLNNSKISIYEDMAHWEAIPSTVSDVDILGLENYFGHKLPTSYISFLQYRHFIELQLDSEYQISFFKNLPDSLVSDTIEEINDFYLSLRNRNYLPFALLVDSGVVCFNANESNTSNEYSIVSFDHEDGFNKPKLVSKNFEELFGEFEKNLIAWIKFKRDNKNAT